MKKITLNLPQRAYPIIVSNSELSELANILTKKSLGDYAIIVTNKNIKKHYESSLSNALKTAHIQHGYILVPDSEKAKSIKEFTRVIKQVATLSKNRKPYIIAFGGGVIGDLAGFVASSYKRGIPYVQIPTTLLAQVDSSIGGKVAIDLTEGKNLVGAFYQPALVYSNIRFLKSLSERNIQSGLAEIIKYGIIKDKELFLFLEQNYTKVKKKDATVFKKIIHTCSSIKARTVEIDEKDCKGPRALLNFGHTIGHAVEACSEYSKSYTHGEAVAIGMVCAADISASMGLISSATAKRIESLIASVNLPVNIENISVSAIMEAMKYDKKFKGKINRFVLIRSIGKAFVRENVPVTTIKKVLTSRCK